MSEPERIKNFKEKYAWPPQYPWETDAYKAHALAREKEVRSTNLFAAAALLSYPCNSLGNERIVDNEYTRGR